MLIVIAEYLLISRHVGEQFARIRQSCANLSKRLSVTQCGNNIFSLHGIICQINLKSPWVALGVLHHFSSSFRDVFHVCHLPCSPQHILVLGCLSHKVQ